MGEEHQMKKLAKENLRIEHSMNTYMEVIWVCQGTKSILEG